MKNLNYQTGKLGEKIACEYLVKKGYHLVEPNFHTRLGEIDLILNKNKRLVFLEVKTKFGEEFGTPEEMINKHKLSQILNTANVFLQKNPRIGQTLPSFQIDVVCIVLNPDRSVKRISHWENIGSELV